MVTAMETPATGQKPRFGARHRLWRRTLATGLLGLAALFALTAAGAAPARAAQVVIILDGSGSMAGRIGGVPKMTLAQQALGQALGDAPDDLAIGLVAYGHRRKGACSDVEVLTRPAPGSLAAVTRTIPNVRAIGNTPMADSIRQAAASVADPNEPATIVLVTDGFENCDPQPCLTLTALKQAQPNLRVHVVGFALSEVDAAALACIAETTGGTYIQAPDGNAGLVAALREVLADAWYVAPEVPLPVAALHMPETAEQGIPFAIDVDGPVGKGDEIRISWIGTPPQSYIGAVFVRDAAQPVHITAPLEIGRYEVRYWFAERGRVLATMPLRVVPPTPALDAPATVPQGGEFRVVWKGPVHGRALVRLAGQRTAAGRYLAEAVVTRTSGPAVLVAPLATGTYELRYLDPTVDPPLLATRLIEVVPAEIGLAVDGTVVAAGEFAVTWKGPGAEGDEVRLARAGSPDADYLNGASLNPIFGDRVRLTAPAEAGTYELRYWSGATGGVVGRASVVVGAVAAALEAPAEVAAGTRFEVLWTGPAGGFDRIELAAAGEPAGRAGVFARDLRPSRPAVLDAPPAAGAYELRYIAGPGRVVVATRPVRVTPAIVELGVGGPVEAGERFAVAWTGPAAPFDELRLTIPAGDASTWLSAARVAEADGPAQIAAPALPGQYQVSYWSARTGTVLGTVAVEVVCTRCPPPAPLAPPAAAVLAVPPEAGMLPAPPAAALPPDQVVPLPANPALGPALAPPIAPPQGLTPITR